MQMLSQLVQSFRDGGPVMWPILILSVVGAAIVFDRLFAFIFALEPGGRLCEQTEEEVVGEHEN